MGRGKPASTYDFPPCKNEGHGLSNDWLQDPLLVNQKYAQVGDSVVPIWQVSPSSLDDPLTCNVFLQPRLSTPLRTLTDS